ncbi:P-loop NTPase fold protein [Acinetobacter indicus]|uniref:P-loop NTPase fold protein n=1 Tax=Acinetobacter indicus TaxID=756892 RepID=UPI000CEC74A2|nr:P-loop NTPase fold protein [Acinetobacter indicus]
MRSYISEPNKHIQDYLDYYFDGKKNFEYAVLLNGAWGSGKTWFVKKYLEKKEDQGKKICYVSLNGIAKTSLIDEAIFKSIHPILGSKGAKLAGQILKGTLKATVKIDLDGDSKSDGSISGGIPKIELPDYLKINDNFILVFDDLERCELKKEEVLGYINYFVEQEGIKTLIVSNEEEIKDNDEYARKKEKLIGATFTYIEDQNLAIQSILDEISKSELKTLLNSEFELIRQTFNQVGYKNLRAFKQTVFDFERFYKKEYFSYKDSFDPEIFKKVLKAFLILSLENKKGRFHKEILNFNPDLQMEVPKKPEDKIAEAVSGFEGNDAQEFYKKYQMGMEGYIFNQKLWDQILNKNIILDETINNELYESYFRLKEEKPTWLELMDFWELEATEFDLLVNKAKYEIEKSSYTHTTDVLHTISMLIYFKEHNLVHFNIDSLLPLAISQFKQLFNVNDRIRKLEDSSFREYSGQYGFYAKDIPQFKKFMDDIVKSYEEKYIEKNSERVEELLDLIENDAWLFAQRIILNNSGESLYWDFPILKEINSKEFASKLCKISRYNSNYILSGLDQRYSIQASFNMYIEEKDWLDEVEINIKTKILPSADKILRAKINLHILPKLAKIKENAVK